MPAITAENAHVWQSLADALSRTRPSVGKRVLILRGRKHKGKEGIVIGHILDRYYDAFRYCSDAQAHMREMRGRSGYVVKVSVNETGETFWCKADYAAVWNEPGQCWLDDEAGREVRLEATES